MEKEITLDEKELELAIKKAKIDKEKEQRYLLELSTKGFSEEELKKERDKIEKEMLIISKSGSKKEVFEILLDWNKRSRENKIFKISFILTRVGDVLKKDMVGEFECFKNLSIDTLSFLFRLTNNDKDKLFNSLACEFEKLKNKNNNNENK